MSKLVIFFLAKAAITVASVMYQRNLAKKAQDKAYKEADRRKGFEFVVEGAVSTLPIAYGKNKIGGSRVFHATRDTLVVPATNSDTIFLTGAVGSNRGGDRNEFLFFQQAICQAPIHKVYDIIINNSLYINNPLLSKTTSSSKSKGLHGGRAGFRVECYNNGSAACNTIKANFSERNTATFTGVAYASVVVALNRDEPAFGGVPDVQFLLEGRLVRTVSNGLLSAQKVYSNNPAWCLLDYLLEFKKIPQNKLVLSTFESAANVCNTIVMPNAATGGKLFIPTNGSRNITNRALPLYECNLLIDTSRPFRENVKDILATMGNATLVWSQGKYKLSLQYPGINEAGLQLADTINDDDLVLSEDITIKWPDTDERLNNATVRFHNEVEEFKEDTASWPAKQFGSYIRGVGGILYPQRSGWDTSIPGRFLGEWAVWNGNTGSTSMNWKIRPYVSGLYTLKYNFYESGFITIGGYNFNSSNWESLGTSSSISLTAGLEYNVSITASSSKELKGAAATLEGPDGAILWSTRSEAYSGFEVIDQSGESAVYNIMMTEDNNVELEADIFVPGITDYYHAKAKAEEIVRTSRTAFNVTFTYVIRRKYFEPGDYILFSSETLGIGTEGPLYLRVEAAKTNDDGTCLISAKRFVWQQLAWNVEDNEYPRPTPVWDSRIPAPMYLEYLPNISDLKNTIGSLNWPEVYDSRVTHYNLYVHESGVLNDFGEPLFKLLGSSEAPPYSIHDLTLDAVIFGVTSVTGTGMMSEMTTTSLLNVERAPPPTPILLPLSLTGPNNTQVHVEWVIPELRDDGSPYVNHFATLIYRSRINDIQTADLVGTVPFGQTYTDTPFEAGVVYYWIRFVSYAGVFGPFSLSQNINVDFWNLFIDETINPPPPINLEAFAAFGSIILTWQRVDYSIGGGHDVVLVYGMIWPEGQPEPSIGSAPIIASVPFSEVYRHTTNLGERWIFWVREKSKSGGVSVGFGGPAIAQTGLIAGVDLGPAIIDADNIKNGGVTAAKLADEITPVVYYEGPSLPVESIGLVLLWNGSLYSWNETEGAYQGSFEPGPNSITETMIADDSISTPKLRSNSIESRHILAEQITAGKLGVGAVLADNLAANSITVGTAAIAAGAIRDLMIESLHGDKIVAGSITGAKIQAGSITAAEIDTRGLSIRDNAGNIILGAGTGVEGVDWNWITGAQRPQSGATRNVYIGPWQVGLLVEVGDFVTFEGSSWISTTQHTASLLNKPPNLPSQSNTWWALMAQHGEPGIGAKNIRLSATSQVFKIDKNESYTPSSITFTVTGENLGNSPSFTISAGSALETVNTTTRTLSFVDMNADVVQVSVNWDGLSDVISVFKLREGQDGTSIDIQGTLSNTSELPPPPQSDGTAYIIDGDLWMYSNNSWQNTGQIQGPSGENALIGFLTNESHTISANTDSTLPIGALNGATGTFKVFHGLQDVTSSSTFSLISQVGCDASINSSGVYSLSSMSADTATVTLQAVYLGINIQKIFTISKSKTGVKGADGSNPVTGYLTNEAHTVFANFDGTVPVDGFTGASGSFIVYDGTTNVTSSTNFSRISYGVTGSINSSGEYSVTAMPGDSGSMTLIATYNGITVTKEFTLSKSRAGADGSPGQGLVLTADKQAFTYIDGNASPSSQSIVFTAALHNLSGTVSWSSSPSVSLTGTGNSRTLSIANFGSNRQTTITASLGGFSDKITVVKLNDSTAQANATAGATIGTNLIKTGGGIAVSSDFVAAFNKLSHTNINTYVNSAAITQAYIASAAIGNAQIDRASANRLLVNTADIIDLSVTTLKIAGNAVTIPVGASGVGSATIGATDFEGAPVLIVASGQGVSNTGEAEVLSIVLRRGTTSGTILQTVAGGVTNSGQATSAATTLAYNPGAGSHQFTVQVTGGVSPISCNISVIGLKR